MVIRIWRCVKPLYFRSGEGYFNNGAGKMSGYFGNLVMCVEVRESEECIGGRCFGDANLK